MAKSWADMSKEERQEAGGSKKAYNKSTGQGRYAEGGSLAHKATVYKPAVEPGGTPVTPQATQERSEAKERAQNYSANGEKINKGTGPNNHYSEADNMSPLQQQMLDRKRAKEEANKPMQPPTFADPNSDEAIAGRQAYLKARKEKGSPEYEAFQGMSADQQVYDPSANEGYAQNLTQAEQHTQKRMQQQYLQQMKERGISFDTGSAYGQKNYQFDMNKGVFVPTASTRQHKASGYDNMYMSGVKSKEALGDRHTYIHQTFDPLKGAFKYDPNAN